MAVIRFSIRVLIWLTEFRDSLNAAATSAIGRPSCTYALYKVASLATLFLQVVCI